MRSKKPYSNVTFTKRVDHEAGRHRTRRSPSEPAQCEQCGAVYRDRRWVNAGSVREGVSWRPVRLTICPACKQQRTGVPAGFLYLGGAFLSEHRSEIDRLLKREAARAAEDNPLGRIMKWEKRGGEHQLVLTTTTEHLAKRLGQALEKAYRGEVRYDFSHENKLARVYWHRD